MSDFIQEGPIAAAPYPADRLLHSYLERFLPDDALPEVTRDLVNFSARLTDDIGDMARDAERDEPRLVAFDPWGRRVDRIEVARGWKQLDRVSAEEGLVAIAYERAWGPLSRLHQFAKLYLFHPSSATYTCPLAMTDGAARVLEVLGSDEPMKDAYGRLVTRDPDRFWTSGQWMTERRGGSDVGQSETIAQCQPDGTYKLFGTKWFTSATTAQMTMTLARVQDAAGNTTPGSRGLSLFYLETRNAGGELNAIRIHRLKDKLGTRALPTAELSLEGSVARLVGQPGRGVAQIALLINVTRIHNAVSSAATMRHALALARDYARRRTAFGRPLAEHPLHVETLAGLEVDFQAAFHLAFYAVLLMGRQECGEASQEETAVLRMLTPLAKLYTAKLCVASMSETLELFGGTGYVHNTGLPRLLCDAQVLPIWEGTTNILSLDTLRAIARDDAFQPLVAHLRGKLRAVHHAQLDDAKPPAAVALDRLEESYGRSTGETPECQQAGARRFSYDLARTTAAVLMLEHAAWGLDHDAPAHLTLAAQRFCSAGLATSRRVDDHHLSDSRTLGMPEP